MRAGLRRTSRRKVKKPKEAGIELRYKKCADSALTLRFLCQHIQPHLLPIVRGRISYVIRKVMQ